MRSTGLWAVLLLLFTAAPAMAGSAEEFLKGKWKPDASCKGEALEEFRFVEGRLHAWNEMDAEFIRLVGVVQQGRLIRTTVRFEGLKDIVVTYRKLGPNRMRMWKVVDKGVLQFDNGRMSNGDTTEVLHRCK